MKILYKTLPVFLFVTSCATAPRPVDNSSSLILSPSELFMVACDAGKSISSVNGTVGMKVKSSEASGQFSANVDVLAPSQLKLEVTNFLGGTEALITVKDQHYEIQGIRGKSQEKKDEGYGSWGGIPLQWATDLFLGKIPCPSFSHELKFNLDKQGKLVVQVPGATGVDPQQFIYSFGNRSGKRWPESLHWERQRAPLVSVDFKFDDPEDTTWSPKKWEAHSSQGAVKVRWRDRNVSLQRAH